MYHLHEIWSVDSVTARLKIMSLIRNAISHKRNRDN